MVHVLIWWLIIQAMGLIALPIALRLFRHLPDRGYAFAKPLGLLLTSYIFWLLVSFGLIRNEAVSILFVMALVAVVSVYLYRRDAADVRIFLKEKAASILTVEFLFLISFAFWAWFRAYNPALDSTERPMDLAFLNAILRSERFPPNDPWLSGFAISYYYFGYLMMAVVTKLSGVPGAISFNIAIALLFAWTMTGAFSLVRNLVERALTSAKTERTRQAALFGLLGSFLVAVIGNLHGFLDAIHARGLGSGAFWSWLDLKRIADAPVTGKWFPTDPPDSWWWWRASRVIHDRDLLGRDSEVIDEFPFFSFLLGDMHPHVLGLPFVLLALALAMNALFAFGRVEQSASQPERQRGEKLLSRIFSRAKDLVQGNAFEIVLTALCLGGLAFLNTWDFPIYLFIFLAAYLLRHYLEHGVVDWFQVVAFAGWITVLGVLFYLPFYVGFRSQAGGILPVLYNVTRLPQYLVMFGFFVFILVSVILCQWRELFALHDAEGAPWLLPKGVLSSGLQIGVTILLLPLLAASLAVLLVTATPTGRAFVQELLARPEVQEAVGGQSFRDLLRRFAMMRLGNPWLVLLLVGMVTALALLIWHRLRLVREEGPGVAQEGMQSANLSAIFAALIASVGLLLTLATEFVYLRDFFMTRMNTIFKFWYQAWVQMAVASAFGVWYIAGRDAAGQGRRTGRYFWLGAFGLLFLASMVYPLAAMYSKAGQFRVEPTLSGTAYMERYRPADYAALRWLQENVEGDPFILEAPGGSYSQYGRVSAQTGLPTVLGWDFHEQQWRGSYEEPGKRLPDIEKIYKSLDTQVVAELLDKYDIEYVYIGDLERQKYGLQPPMVAKFGRIMDLVYDQDGVQIYRRR